MHPTRDTTPPARHAQPSAVKTRAATPFTRLWHSSPPLTAVGTLMLFAAIASLVGIFVDSRVITGVPAWLKPFKFAISTSIYSFTLAWVFGWLSDWPRLRRVVGWTTAIVFVLEVSSYWQPIVSGIILLVAPHTLPALGGG